MLDLDNLPATPGEAIKAWIREFDPTPRLTMMLLEANADRYREIRRPDGSAAYGPSRCILLAWRDLKEEDGGGERAPALPGAGPAWGSLLKRFSTWESPPATWSDVMAGAPAAERRFGETQDDPCPPRPSCAGAGPAWESLLAHFPPAVRRESVR